ncbi:MAG: cellobiose phosphorylase [Clostridia bacterium]|nr:cellobiose phosphorylase [Clostridia bacterium]
MISSNLKEYIINDYQKQKPFSSFLSGISGKMGIPLWSFYVNRGQLIASFGIRDKNGAIMEFFPANNAYHYVSRIGFRTFIKKDGEVHEFFKEKNSNQRLIIRQDQVSIEEHHKDFDLIVKVTYFTLPNEPIAGLVRKVEIKNLGKPCDIEVIDGLAQLIPSGITNDTYKSVSNLMQSWMESIEQNNYLFYKLRASTGDSAEVNEVHDGNFYLTKSSETPLLISDYKLVFDEDTSLETPYQFIEHSIAELSKINQVRVNQVPCAMSGLKFKNLTETTFISLIGNVSDQSILDQMIDKFGLAYFNNKEAENLELHQNVVSSIETKTNFPIFDQYLEQCYLDNVLRGGEPMLVTTKEGKMGYHLYSRKHGDLERDYNFFSLDPSFYSQGNGNFRDVLQNRRNDLFFRPELGDFNIYQFASLIQADGYNPLSIGGVTFKFEGDLNDVNPLLQGLLKNEYTPGMIATKLFHHQMDVEPTLSDVLKESKAVIKAAFGEGYWEDHFTYLYDLIDSYLSVFPDHLEHLIFQKQFPFFVSPVLVLPRNLKYVQRPDGEIRQYGAIKHFQNQQDGWLTNKDGLVHVNLFGKLLTLVLNKYGHLDPYGIGLSYEGNKPGWNDAMNGVPGLFGSGVSETIELQKIVKFMKKIILEHPNQQAILLENTNQLAEKYMMMNYENDFQAWDERMTYLEAYRNSLLGEQNVIHKNVSYYQQVIEKIEKTLSEAIIKAKEINPIYPTYMTYKAEDFEPIIDSKGQHVIGEYGLPVVKVKKFSAQALPGFLEAPARYLKSLSTTDEAKEIYKTIKESEMYDKKLKFYQTSESLDSFGNEIGRIRAFTKGWLERESNFLHMTYKYLLGLLKSGLYNEFYEEIKTNYTCFMDPKIYGRSPIENSSFLATSSNPDPKKRGQGFVSRLSGSTAEMLSMWRYMFLGDHLFTMEDGQLAFELNPKLPKSFFKDRIVETRLFNQTTIIYHLSDDVNTYDNGAHIEKMTLHTDSEICEVQGSKVFGKWTRDIRNGHVFKINVYIIGGK